jgi:hypothetical protein
VFFILIGCERQRQQNGGPTYSSRQILLNEVSDGKCLNLEHLIRHVQSESPEIMASRWTYDVQVNLESDSCAGAEARLMKGNFHFSKQPLAKTFAQVSSLRQPSCEILQAPDGSGRLSEMTSNRMQANENQFYRKDGTGLGLRWINSQQLLFTRRYLAIDLHRPRSAEGHYMPQGVQVSELIEWETSASLTRSVSRHLFETLKESLVLTLEVPVSHETESVDFRETDFVKIEEASLRPELEKCEPFREKNVSPEVTP